MAVIRGHTSTTSAPPGASHQTRCRKQTTSWYDVRQPMLNQSVVIRTVGSRRAWFQAAVRLQKWPEIAAGGNSTYILGYAYRIRRVLHAIGPDCVQETGAPNLMTPPMLRISSICQGKMNVTTNIDSTVHINPERYAEGAVSGRRA